MNGFTSIHSGTMPVQQLPAVIQEYQKKYAKQKITGPSGDFRSFGSLLFHRLEALDAIEVYDLMIGRELDPPGTTGPFHDFIADLGRHTQCTQCRWTTLVERDSPANNALELAVNCGWARNPECGETYWFAGFHIGSASPGYLDKQYRRILIERIVEAMGLASAVNVQLEADRLSVSASAPWRLHYTMAELGGANPLGIRIYGFENYALALRATTSVLNQVARGTCKTKFSTKCGPGQFDVIREPLNSISENWIVEPFGTLTSQAMAVLSGEASDFGEMRRIPALQWAEKRKSVRDVYQVDVLPSEGGCLLEFTTNCGDTDRLLERARVWPDFVAAMD